MGEVKARTHLQDYPFETSPFQLTKLSSCLEKNLISSVKPYYHTIGPPCSWTQSSNAQKWILFTIMPTIKEGNVQKGLRIPYPPSLGKPSDAFAQFSQKAMHPKAQTILTL